MTASDHARERKIMLNHSVTIRISQPSAFLETTDGTLYSSSRRDLSN
jgi:hypothetical protein